MQIIILAAGKGSRMNSTLPKVLHKIGDTTMLERVFNNCACVTNDLILVYSKQLLPHLEKFKEQCKLVEQTQGSGTASAVYSAEKLLAIDKPICVVYADNPLISTSLIESLFNHQLETKAAVVNLAFEYNKSNQYGRIITDSYGNMLEIVETAQATQEQKKITLCNSGIMVFAPNILTEYLPFCIKKNTVEESRLTDIVNILSKRGKNVKCFKTNNYNCAIGINTQEELLHANSLLGDKNYE